MGYDMYAADDRSVYFRAGIGGMPSLREAMWHLGMVAEDGQPWPQMPPDMPGTLYRFVSEDDPTKIVGRGIVVVNGKVDHAVRQERPGVRMDVGANWPFFAPDYESEVWSRFEALQKLHVERVPSPCTGMLMEKFASNDGWLVTPQEIDAALATYDALDDPARTASLYVEAKWWKSWVTFLRRCAKKGGIRVW